MIVKVLCVAATAIGLLLLASILFTLIWNGAAGLSLPELSSAELAQVQQSTTANPAFSIQFDSSLSGATITLNGTELPQITNGLTITGLGASQLAISGNRVN